MNMNEKLQREVEELQRELENRQKQIEDLLDMLYAEGVPLNAAELKTKLDALTKKYDEVVLEVATQTQAVKKCNNDLKTFLKGRDAQEQQWKKDCKKATELEEQSNRLDTENIELRIKVAQLNDMLNDYRNRWGRGEEIDVEWDLFVNRLMGVVKGDSTGMNVDCKIAAIDYSIPGILREVQYELEQRFQRVAKDA